MCEHCSNPDTTSSHPEFEPLPTKAVSQRLRDLASSVLSWFGVARPQPQPLSQQETWERWGKAKGRYNQQVQASIVAFVKDGDAPKLFSELRAELAVLHYQGEVIANGGARFVGADAKRRMDAALRLQERYITRWENEVMSAAPDTFSEAYLSNRASMYGESAQNEMERAYNSALGIPELPFYPKDGRTECMINCKCQWEYVKLNATGDWNIYWRVNRTAEHCPTCLRRETIAAPLKIRNGKVILPPTIAEGFV